MKRITNIALLLMMALNMMAITHTYAPTSILDSGHWIKVRVSETGVQCIPYDSLQKWGLKPENVRVYGYGGALLSQYFDERKIDDLPAVGFYMHKGEDGVFGKGDYILFWGQGVMSWKYDGTAFVHKHNTYTRYGYYFLSDDAGEQRLIESASLANVEGDTTLTTYNFYQVHEMDSLNLLDPAGRYGGGREWYGESFSAERTEQAIRFNIPNIVAGERMTYTADLAAKSMGETVYRLSSKDGSETSINVEKILETDHYTKATAHAGTLECKSVADNPHTLTIRFENRESGALGYLNYVEVEAIARMQLDNSYLPFRTSKGYKTALNMVYTVAGSDNNTQIWDITNLDNITAVERNVQSGTARFVGNNLTGVREYVAVNPNGKAWNMPQFDSEVKNQNLHQLSDIDLVIITPETFLAPSNRLAEEHHKRDHIEVAVVTDKEVYNEFSSGTPDATAYRWLMKMLYDRAGIYANKRPKSLLLMGDGTFDNRKMLYNSGPAMLLTYQAENSLVETKAYATDDYFGFLHNSDGLSDQSGKMDIGVGRLPVSNIDEADGVVDKLIRYMRNENYGSWKQQLLFLADDGDHGLHTQTAEAGAERVRLKNPDFIVHKVYLDAYPQEVNAAGESYPLAKNRVDNLLHDGVLYMNYSGHGSDYSITNEGMLGLRDIQKMTNANMAFWMLATCSFAHFDGGVRCAAEEAVINPNGGAIGVLSACRTVYATQNTTINRNFCDTLFGHKNVYSYEMTIGEACRIAKNKTGNDSNKLPYILLGDPALRLNYPTELQVKTASKLDTINALTVHEVEGYIEDSDKDTATWFNGRVSFTVYDKLQRITTRDNDAKGNDAKELVYNDYPSTVFSGNADVEKGRFHYVFMTPKDIRYNYGTGRIVYYAYDDVEKAEAVGHFEDFYIGGAAESLLVDTVGPEVEIYINSPGFEDGGLTYETPRFFANIEDVNGINTVGSGIGHDLLLTVDGNPKQTYILNNFFRAENNSYQKGQVSYLLPELTEGEHTLVFRAWDLLNNSTTKQMKIQVVKGLDPTIFAVATYPNPVQAGGIMNMTIQYDQPDKLNETTLYVYNLQGQLLYQAHQNNALDMQLNIGQLGLNTGVYIYQVRVKSENSNTAMRSGKFVVTK